MSTRKGRLIMLVDALHSRHLTNGEIGKLLGLSHDRVRQVVMLLQLEPPRFDSFGALCTWLAKASPDLERECRIFRDEVSLITSESSADTDKAA